MDFTLPDLTDFLDWGVSTIGTASQYNEALQDITQIATTPVTVTIKYVTMWQHFVLHL